MTFLKGSSVACRRTGVGTPCSISFEIVEALTKWMAWAQRCRIPVFRDLRMKIKRHFSAIVAAAKFKLSNARFEATNNKIKLIKIPESDITMKTRKGVAVSYAPVQIAV